MKSRLFKFKMPKTMAFFPVGPEETHEQDRKGMRGVALIIAVMIISIMMMFASDFIVSATVDLTMASAERDNVKAEYVAKSGANWALWLNLFDYGIDAQLSSSKDPMMQQAKSVIGPLWNKLGEIFPFDTPMDLSNADAFAQAFGLSNFLDSKVIDLLKSLGGELGVDVSDEGGKINLNVCYQSRTSCKIMALQLDALMNCTEVEKDYMKQQNIKTQEIVARIQDWVDQDQTAEPLSGISGENDPYQKRVPSHKAKNSPLDTVDELRMVDGWTQELHSYFSHYLTVFPFVYPQDKEKNGFKININTANQDVLKCFFQRELSNPEVNDKFAKKYKELMDAGGQIATDDKALEGLMKDLVGFQGDPADKGKETDRSSWFTTTSRAYVIRAKGIVGSQTKIYEMAIERQSVAQRKVTPNTPPWRVDSFRMR